MTPDQMAQTIAAQISSVVRPRIAPVLAARTPEQSFLAAYIQYRINEIGYPIKEVATAMGKTRQFVYAVMGGKCLIPEDFIVRLAKATQISLPELLGARAISLAMDEGL